MAQLHHLHQKAKRGLATVMVISTVILLLNADVSILSSFVTESNEAFSGQKNDANVDGANLFKFRRKRLEKVCKTFKDPFRAESVVLSSDEPTSSISDFNYFILDKKSYMTCAIHKVGSNSMHEFLNQIQSKQAEKFANNEIDNALEFTVTCVTGKQVCNVDPSLLNEQLPVSVDCWPNCASNHLKIMVVRHPLERFLSAYRYVFDSNLEPRDRQQGKFYKSEESMEWTEFVHHVINFGDESWLEKQTTIGTHWEPFWRFCSTCHQHLMPDYILKFENFQQDLKILLDELNLSEFSDDFPHSGLNSGGHSSKKIQNYYSRLSKETIRQLYQVYKLDHDLFDYKPDKFIEMGYGN